MKQTHNDLRQDIAKVSSELGTIAKNAHTSLLRELASSIRVDADTGEVNVKLMSDKGQTAFGVYRSWYCELAKERLEMKKKLRDMPSEDREIIRILENLLADYHVMDFIILMSLVTFGQEPKLDSKVAAASCEITLDELVPNWNHINIFRHYGYLLANY